jgi:hypothetical protein
MAAKPVTPVGRLSPAGCQNLRFSQRFNALPEICFHDFGYVG